MINLPGRQVEPQQNWLARFLHIKPAAKVLCFQVGRGRARQEIVKLLREWKRFGVKDISFDRETNVILARVDKENREHDPFLLDALIDPKLVSKEPITDKCFALQHNRLENQTSPLCRTPLRHPRARPTGQSLYRQVQPDPRSGLELSEGRRRPRDGHGRQRLARRG